MAYVTFDSSFPWYTSGWLNIKEPSHGYYNWIIDQHWDGTVRRWVSWVEWNKNNGYAPSYAYGSKTEKAKPHTQDPVVDRVIQKFKDRSAQGMTKYGVSMEANKAPTVDWIKHTQEELMDAILYLEKLKATLVGPKEDNTKYENVSTWGKTSSADYTVKPRYEC